MTLGYPPSPSSVGWSSWLAEKAEAEKVKAIQEAAQPVQCMSLEELTELVSEHWQGSMARCYMASDGWRCSALVTIQCPFTTCSYKKQIGLVLFRSSVKEVRVYCNGCDKQALKIWAEMPLPMPGEKA